MSTNSGPKFHHYVPRLLLKRFGERKGKKHQVNVFDKHEGRSFRTSVDNIMGQTHFNTIEIEGEAVSFEGLMGGFEDRAAPVLDRIIQDRMLAGLDRDGKMALISFISLQLSRGTSERAMYADMLGQLREKFTKIAGEDGIPEELKGELSENDLKEAGLRLTFAKLDEVAVVLHHKDMLLLEAPPGASFMLGDNPVAITNSQPSDRIYGNLGLTSLGIEIYMPISSDLCIALWCPSIREKVRLQLEAARGRVRLNAAMLQVFGESAQAGARAQLAMDIRTIRIGEGRFPQNPSVETIRLSPENVRKYNSLQISHSERYVIDPAGKFGLVREMLQANERYRYGRRMMVG